MSPHKGRRKGGTNWGGNCFFSALQSGRTQRWTQRRWTHCRERFDCLLPV